MEIGESANWPPGGQGLRLPPTVYSRVSPGGGTPWSWASVLTRKRNQLWHASGNTPFVLGTKFKLHGQALEVLPDLASAYFSSLLMLPWPSLTMYQPHWSSSWLCTMQALVSLRTTGRSVGVRRQTNCFRRKNVYKRYSVGRSQDGGGIGRGDHFLFYKLIERTTERWTKLQNNFWSLAADIRRPEKQPTVFEGR